MLDYREMLADLVTTYMVFRWCKLLSDRINHFVYMSYGHRNEWGDSSSTTESDQRYSLLTVSSLGFLVHLEIDERPFEYPSVSRLDLLVIVLVNARLFEPVSFVEGLPGRVGYLNVKVYAVDLRGLRPSDRVQQRFHHLRTYASRPIWR